MKKLLKLLGLIAKKSDAPNLEKITEQQLHKNMDVLQSLRDYDQGKKDIPTHNVRKHLPRIRVAP